LSRTKEFNQPLLAYWCVAQSGLCYATGTQLCRLSQNLETDKYNMTRLLAYHYIKQFITYFPAPLFFILFLYSMFSSSVMSICGIIPYEMPLMWFLMSLAHARPWVTYLEIKHCPNGCGCKSD
jgi:hypothetical protein